MNFTSSPGENKKGVSDLGSNNCNGVQPIIALDNLHRAKKISDESYQKRRAELKEILKEMM